MTGIERRQCEMLVRVRNFGEMNRGLFEGSPMALQTFAAVGTAVAALAAADARKMIASAAARAEQRAAARDALQQMLQDVARLAGQRRAEGQTVPPFVLPTSKSDTALLTAGRVFATDAAAVDADFSAHGLGPSQLQRATTALETAVNHQGINRTEHVAARRKIRELIATGLRAVRRLDLMLTHEIPIEVEVRDQWAQLSRIERKSSRARSAAPQTGERPAEADAAKEVGHAAQA